VAVPIERSVIMPDCAVYVLDRVRDQNYEQVEFLGFVHAWVPLRKMAPSGASPLGQLGQPDMSKAFFVCFVLFLLCVFVVGLCLWVDQKSKPRVNTKRKHTKVHEA